ICWPPGNAHPKSHAQAGENPALSRHGSRLPLHGGRMITETSELQVFHCVVKHASYTRAADELGLSPSGVSRVVSRLEERLGARLVQRTTRKFSLTEAGAEFHARTVQVLADLAEAEAEVQRTARNPRGTLRISAPVVFGQLHLTPMRSEEHTSELQSRENLVCRLLP